MHYYTDVQKVVPRSNQDNPRSRTRHNSESLLVISKLFDIFHFFIISTMVKGGYYRDYLISLIRVTNFDFSVAPLRKF